MRMSYKLHMKGSFICQPYTTRNIYGGFVQYRSRNWIDMAHASHMPGTWLVSFFSEICCGGSGSRLPSVLHLHYVPLIFCCTPRPRHGRNFSAPPARPLCPCALSTLGRRTLRPQASWARCCHHSISHQAGPVQTGAHWGCHMLCADH
jgi:hypothetical protein